MKRTIVAAAAVVLAAAGSAQAGYTPINTSSEPNLTSIFTTTYGSLTNTTTSNPLTQAELSAGASFTSSLGYSFTRVHDNGYGTPTDLHSNYSTLGTPTTDERFSDGTTQVSFTVKYAGLSNHFGYSDTTGSVTSGNYTDIIGNSGSATVTLSSNFQFALDIGNGHSSFWGSDTGQNTDSYDHFVTWYVQGNGRSFWVIGVEDLSHSSSDLDYNDWVGEVQVVPLPPGAWAGISSLAGVAGVGLIRRRRISAI